MEPNNIFAVASLVMILAAVILTYKFGSRRRNDFAFDLLKAIAEPARRTNQGDVEYHPAGAKRDHQQGPRRAA